MAAFTTIATAAALGLTAYSTIEGQRQASKAAYEQDNLREEEKRKRNEAQRTAQARKERVLARRKQRRQRGRRAGTVSEGGGGLNIVGGMDKIGG